MVVPAYDVEAYLAECLDSVLAQALPGDEELEVVVVDDGSSDGTGAIADSYAAREPRVRVVHTGNRGLGAARNEGARHVRGQLLAFADSDDVVPPAAYATLLSQLDDPGCDVVTGSIAWWENGRLREPPWMRRLHRERAVLQVEQHPELLGDVFAWNKLYRWEFWRGAELSWPEGTRYEDQPTTTRALLRARRVGVVPEVVYHWRIRTDGSSITQQRGTLEDLRDRWETKRATLADVADHGSAAVSEIFADRVLPGDLHRYFVLIPEADDAWYALLEQGVQELFGERSLVHSGLPPVHRLTGWLVEQGRRDDAVLVQRALAAVPPGRRLGRVTDQAGVRLDVPGLDAGTVDRAALALRPHER